MIPRNSRQPMFYFLATLLTCCNLASASESRETRGAPFPGVIAQDDFGSPGSGVGWALGDDWDGAVGGGVATVVGGEVFRTFFQAIDTTAIDRLYIAFDLSRSLDQFSGLSFFSGQQEEVFVGRPFLANQYGFSVVGSPFSTPGGPDIDEEFHRIVLEIDFGGGMAGSDLLRLFVDQTSLDIPDATEEVDPSRIPDSLDRLRIASDGEVLVDNLVVSDAALPLFVVFADGFESGNTSAWSQVVP